VGWLICWTVFDSEKTGTVYPSGAPEFTPGF
jgi:hypothetical protein